MVKFSKELEAQLIPEWRDAFVNYWQLKKQIKKIKISKTSKLSQIDTDHDFITRLSIFDPIRFIVNKISQTLFADSAHKTDIIQVSYSIYTLIICVFSFQSILNLIFGGFDIPTTY